MNTNNKTGYFFCEIGEFHAFQKFNMFLWKLEQKKLFDKIVAIYPMSAKGIITHSTSDIIITNTFIRNLNNATYPNILENMNGRNMDTVFLKVKEMLMNRDPNIELYTYHYDRVTDAYGNSCFEDFFNPKLYGTEPSLLGLAETRDFLWLKEWLEAGNLLYPTTSTYLDMKYSFHSLFDFKSKTFILLTRNFKNKQPETNTEPLFPNTFLLVEEMLKNDIAVINVGFPPSQRQDLKDKYKHYIEFYEEELTQEHLMSLFYLSNGVLLNAENGGYTAHVSCNANMHVLSKEYTERIRGINHGAARRLGNKSVQTFDWSSEMENKKFDFIIDEMKKSKKNNELKFMDDKEIEGV